MLLRPERVKVDLLLSGTTRHHQILGFNKSEEILPTFLPTTFLVIYRIFKISRKIIIMQIIELNNKIWTIKLFNAEINYQIYS